MEDEHLRSLCFGDYMHPEAEKKIYDEIPDVTLLTKAMDHYLKVLIPLTVPSIIMIQFPLDLIVDQTNMQLCMGVYHSPDLPTRGDHAHDVSSCLTSFQHAPSMI